MVFVTLLVTRHACLPCFQAVISHGTKSKLKYLVRKRSESVGDISSISKPDDTEKANSDLSSIRRRSSMSDARSCTVPTNTSLHIDHSSMTTPDTSELWRQGSAGSDGLGSPCAPVCKDTPCADSTSSQIATDVPHSTVIVTPKTVGNDDTHQTMQSQRSPADHETTCEKVTPLPVKAPSCELKTPCLLEAHARSLKSQQSPVTTQAPRTRYNFSNNLYQAPDQADSSASGMSRLL